MRKTGKFLCTLLAAALCLCTAACGKDEGPDASLSDNSRKIGLGCVAARVMDGKDKTAVKATVAAVLLASDGKILDCRVDEVEYTVRLTEGKPGDVGVLDSKRDQGDRYTLTDKDTGGSANADGTWRKQADAFAAFTKGKMPGDISGLAATDGKSDQIDGCSLVITDLIRAVRAASDAAVACKAGAADTLHLALITEKADDATADKPQYDTQLAAVTTSGGRLTACRTDTLQVKLTVENGAFTTASGEVQTKRAIGDAYGMKEASSLKKEWYEQANTFDAYAAGKTPAELSGLKLGADGKTDAIAGCTIGVSGLLKAAVKAAETT